MAIFGATLLRMKITGWVLFTAGASVVLAGCGSGGGSSKSYKTISCGDYAAMVNASDATTNGSLDIANAYLDASPIDPRGGADDVAAFGDQIVALCSTTTADTKIIDLKAQVVAVYLAKHPEDRP